MDKLDLDLGARARCLEPTSPPVRERRIGLAALVTLASLLGLITSMATGVDRAEAAPSITATPISWPVVAPVAVRPKVSGRRTRTRAFPGRR
ncbi:MAG: hypothetical protein ACKORA_07415 [Solirubrobacterales bacterium]